MELNTHNAEILLSAANKSHYPQDELPEIALAGRSNVGKSSFINTMLNRKNLARTSGKPGKTQLLNFFNIDDKMRFVDVPGYGYARVSKKEREKWGRMIEEYLTTRENLRAVVSLVDLRHDPSADDVQMYEFLKYYEIPVIIVATKADKIPRGKWNKHESAIKKKLNFDPSDDFILFSSVSKAGMDEAWDAILEKIVRKRKWQKQFIQIKLQRLSDPMFKEKSLATFCLLVVKFLSLLKLGKSLEKRSKNRQNKS